MSIPLAEASVARLLKGQAVEVSVGEPWDFESSAGPNRLEGRIIEVAATGPEQFLTMRVTPFVAKTGERVDTLKATARYTEDVARIVGTVADGGKVPATLDYGGQISPAKLAQGSHPFLIGSVRLI